MCRGNQGGNKMSTFAALNASITMVGSQVLSDLIKSGSIQRDASISEMPSIVDRANIEKQFASIYLMTKGGLTASSVMYDMSLYFKAQA
jgi:hypothetical protein